MNARMILASVTGAILLASPLAASATSTKASKPAAASNSCKSLKGQALKDCKAKAEAAKKAAKTK